MAPAVVLNGGILSVDDKYTKVPTDWTIITSNSTFDGLPLSLVDTSSGASDAAKTSVVGVAEGSLGS